MVDSIQRMPVVTPTWATDTGVTLEPTLAEREAGWPEGFKPPARWQNDYQRKVFQICDNMGAAIRKTWITSLDDTNLPFDVDALGWHNGYYYTMLESGSERISRSKDLRRWTFVAAPSVLAVSCNTIASDGTRVLFARTGVATNTFYSDNDGVTATANPTGVGVNSRIFYLPVAGLWLGCNDTGTIISSDGATFAATSGFVGSTFGGNFGAAENSDASIILVGDDGGAFSTDSGVTFADNTNGGGLSLKYYYSEIRSNFVGWAANGALHEMTGTAGTWNAAAFATISPTFQVSGMFDMHGAMYAYGVNEDSGTAAPDSLDMVMTLDQGATWEVVHTFGDDAAGANFLAHLNPVKPQTGHVPGENTGFVGMVNIDRTSIAPFFTGTDFAAELT